MVAKDEKKSGYIIWDHCWFAFAHNMLLGSVDEMGRI